MVDFLLGNTSVDPTNLQRMRFKCGNYKLIDGVLYKGEASAPLQRCISRPEGQSLLEDIHKRGNAAPTPPQQPSLERPSDMASTSRRRCSMPKN